MELTLKQRLIILGIVIILGFLITISRANELLLLAYICNAIQFFLAGIQIGAKTKNG